MADTNVKSRESVGEITVKLNVDASDALTALKALQREVRKATQALKSAEQANSIRIERVGNYAVTEIKRDLSAYSTKDLTDELARRTGVREIVVEPYETVEIWKEKPSADGVPGSVEIITGPARILVNVD